MRHWPAVSPSRPASGELVLDPARHSVVYADARVLLTPTEFRMLAAVTSRPGEVVRRRVVIAAAWPDGARVHDNTVDSYATRIRRKLERVGSPVQLRTGKAVAEKFSLGYLTTLGLFSVIIAIIAALWKSTPVNGVLAFWLAYIITRPLGASTGDWLSQQGNQGLNLGNTTTSYLFLGIIVALVIYLQIRKPDVTPVDLVNADGVHHPHLAHPHHEVGRHRYPHGL